MMSPEMYFARHVKIQDPFVTDAHDLTSPVRVTAHFVAMVEDIQEQCVLDSIIDEAKRMGVTDLYLIDRVFARKAISNAVPQNVLYGCICPKCAGALSEGMSYCPRCGQSVRWME